MVSIRGWSDSTITHRTAMLTMLMRRAWRIVADATHSSLIAVSSTPRIDDVDIVMREWLAQLDSPIIAAHIRGLLRNSGQHVREQLRVGAHLDVYATSLGPQIINRHQSEFAQRLYHVGNDIWLAAREQVVTGLQSGETAMAIARRVHNVTGMTPARAMMIARTEVHSAHEAGMYAQMVYLDPDAKKTWRATPDPQTRESHMLANGQTVPMLDTFAVGTSSLRYPGDPLAPFGEIVNCRCETVYSLSKSFDTIDSMDPSDLSDNAALIAAAIKKRKWNPLLHPRGKDGRFITKGTGIFKLLTSIFGKDYTPGEGSKLLNQIDQKTWNNLTNDQKAKITQIATNLPSAQAHVKSLAAKSPVTKPKTKPKTPKPESKTEVTPSKPESKVKPKLPDNVQMNDPIDAYGKKFDAFQHNQVSAKMDTLAKKPNGYDDNAEVQVGEHAYYAALNASNAIFKKVDGTSDEWHAPRTYQSQVAEAWNRSLRTGKPITGISATQKKSIKRAQPTLDDMIAKSELPHAVRVYRGMKSPGSDFTSQLIKGNTITDNGYSSTSTNKSFAQGFTGHGGVLFEIDVPAGTHGIAPSRWTTRFEQEREFLLGRGTSFEILDDPKVVDGVTVVRARVVPDELTPEVTPTITAPETTPTPTPEVGTPTATPALPDIHKGKKPGEPAKVTTTLIWSKHPPNTVILEGQNGDTRVVWNGKKYQLESRDPLGTWSVDTELTKKAAYENFKDDTNWVVPGANVGAPGPPQAVKTETPVVPDTAISPPVKKAVPKTPPTAPGTPKFVKNDNYIHGASISEVDAQAYASHLWQFDEVLAMSVDGLQKISANGDGTFTHRKFNTTTGVWQIDGPNLNTIDAANAIQDVGTTWALPQHKFESITQSYVTPTGSPDWAWLGTNTTQLKPGQVVARHPNTGNEVVFNGVDFVFTNTGKTVSPNFIASDKWLNSVNKDWQAVTPQQWQLTSPVQVNYESHEEFNWSDLPDLIQSFDKDQVIAVSADGKWKITKTGDAFGDMRLEQKTDTGWKNYGKYDSNELIEAPDITGQSLDEFINEQIESPGMVWLHSQEDAGQKLLQQGITPTPSLGPAEVKKPDGEWVDTGPQSHFTSNAPGGTQLNITDLTPLVNDSMPFGAGTDMWKKLAVDHKNDPPGTVVARSSDGNVRVVVSTKGYHLDKWDEDSNTWETIDSSVMLSDTSISILFPQDLAANWYGPPVKSIDPGPVANQHPGGKPLDVTTQVINDWDMVGNIGVQIYDPGGVLALSSDGNFRIVVDKDKTLTVQQWDSGSSQWNSIEKVTSDNLKDAITEGYGGTWVLSPNDGSAYPTKTAAESSSTPKPTSAASSWLISPSGKPNWHGIMSNSDKLVSGQIVATHPKSNFYNEIRVKFEGGAGVGGLFSFQEWDLTTGTWATLDHATSKNLDLEAENFGSKWNGVTPDGYDPLSDASLLTPSTPAVPDPSTTANVADISGIPDATKKSWKKDLGQEKIGYWSKPDALWTGIQQIHAANPEYTPLQIIKSLDDVTSTKDPSPFETKLKKWAQTAKGSATVKAALTGALDQSTTTPGQSITTPVQPIEKPKFKGYPTIFTGDESVDIDGVLSDAPRVPPIAIWDSALDSPSGTILAYSDVFGSPSFYRAVVTKDLTTKHKTVTIQRLNKSSGTWQVFDTHNTLESLKAGPAFTFTWKSALNAPKKTTSAPAAKISPPVKGGTKAAAPAHPTIDLGDGDISHLTLYDKKNIAATAKWGPSNTPVSLKSPGPKLWQHVKSTATKKNLTPLQVIHALDEAYTPPGKTNEHLYKDKILKWAKTKNGAAIIAGAEVTSPSLDPSKALPSSVKLRDEVANIGIPSRADSDKYTYNKVETYYGTNNMNDLWKEIVEKHGAWTSSEQSALKNFTGDAFTQINDFMRFGKNPQKAMTARSMQKGMRPSTRPVLLVRGVSSLTQLAPKPEGIKPGMTYNNASFMSTSAGNFPGYAAHKQILLEIEVPPGTPLAWVDPISKNKGENEVILAAGLNFEVISVSPNKEMAHGKKTVVRVRVVP